MIQLTITCPGKIVGIDNGSSVSIERFQSTRGTAFHGQLLALLRATASGSLTLTATAEGLEPATLKF